MPLCFIALGQNGTDLFKVFRRDHFVTAFVCPLKKENAEAVGLVFPKVAENQIRGSAPEIPVNQAVHVALQHDDVFARRQLHDGVQRIVAVRAAVDVIADQNNEIAAAGGQTHHQPAEQQSVAVNIADGDNAFDVCRVSE